MFEFVVDLFSEFGVGDEVFASPGAGGAIGYLHELTKFYIVDEVAV